MADGVWLLARILVTKQDVAKYIGEELIKDEAKGI